MRYLNVHFLSPIFYFYFVKAIKRIPPCPKSKLMLSFRKYHNINLSLLSGVMLIGVFTGNIISNKILTPYDIICKPYDDNIISRYSFKLFLYTKYLEWGDTLFLQLSSKPISQLQFIHHMSTAWLMYLNQVDYPSPSLLVYVGMNCFVHVPMYWYFAFPKGVLKNYRQTITNIQILQHVVCIMTSIYSVKQGKGNCEHNDYGGEAGLIMYTIYLLYFLQFYLQNYLRDELKCEVSSDHFKIK